MWPPAEAAIFPRRKWEFTYFGNRRLSCVCIYVLHKKQRATTNVWSV